MDHKPKKMWLQGAIKDTSHPVQRAAERKGISTIEEEKHEAKSPDAHIRSRGLLGLRFSRHKI